MAIIANYLFRGVPVQDVYIRPQSIGGAKNYNWAASFAVFANQEMSQSFDNNLDLVTVTFPWADGQDVYADAYAKMAQHETLTNVRRG